MNRSSSSGVGYPAVTFSSSSLHRSETEMPVKDVQQTVTRQEAEGNKEPFIFSGCDRNSQQQPLEHLEDSLKVDLWVIQNKKDVLNSYLNNNHQAAMWLIKKKKTVFIQIRQLFLLPKQSLLLALLYRDCCV